jgi:hypothetical protein
MAKYTELDYVKFLKNYHNEKTFKECFFDSFDKVFIEAEIKNLSFDKISENVIEFIDDFIDEGAQEEYGEGGTYYDAFMFYSYQKYELYWIQCDGEVIEFSHSFSDVEKAMEEIINDINN